MSKELENIYRERIDFSKLKTAFPIPDLLAIQKLSYAEFLQMELLPEERKDSGLQAAFKDSFPVSDFKETTQLDFISYSIGDWECKCGRLKGVENSRGRCNGCGTLLPADAELTEKEICPYCGAMKKIEIQLCDHCGDKVGLKMKYRPTECLQKGYTYAVPLRLKVRLISWDKDPETKTKRLKHIKEQEVYFGEIPLMTEKGTFIFNGIERVVVSQLQRSPGVFFRQPGLPCPADQETVRECPAQKLVHHRVPCVRDVPHGEEGTERIHDERRRRLAPGLHGGVLHALGKLLVRVLRLVRDALARPEEPSLPVLPRDDKEDPIPREPEVLRHDRLPLLALEVLDETVRPDDVILSREPCVLHDGVQSRPLHELVRFRAGVMNVRLGASHGLVQALAVKTTPGAEFQKAPLRAPAQGVCEPLKDDLIDGAPVEIADVEPEG